MTDSDVSDLVHSPFLLSCSSAVLFLQALGYWSIRGLAQTVRNLFAYGGIPFADVRYQQGGESSEWTRDAWLSVKQSVGLDFPNLPYLLDEKNQLRLSQSVTIMRHIGRQLNLLGTDVKQSALCDLILDQAYDYKTPLVGMCYGRGPSKEEFARTTLPQFMSQFEAFRAAHPTQWMAGETITIADFFLYEMIDQSTLLMPEAMQPYEKLRAFKLQFESLPAIQQYRASPHYIERPINNMRGLQ